MHPLFSSRCSPISQFQFGLLVALCVRVPETLPRFPRFLPESHLVLGTDFSHGSTAALAEARRLESWVRSQVAIVHVIAHGESDWQTDPIAWEWLRKSGLTEPDIVVLRGQAAASLVRFAGSINALAVIVGSHGRSGYQSLRLGYTAARVATIAECPVLVVNPREELTTIHRSAGLFKGSKTPVSP